MKIFRHSKSIPKVGLEVVDNQHKVLFDLANDLNNSIKVGASLSILDALLSVLLNYSLHHFQSEEEYFKGQAEYATHCLEHYECTKRLTTAILDIKNDRIMGNLTPLAFFTDWLHDHIERFDKPLLAGEAGTQRTWTVPADQRVQAPRERRKNKRIPYHAVVDEEIVAQCFNSTHLNRGYVKILDMSPGGLKLHSTNAHNVSDLMLISCSIGRNFKMKEKVKVITARDQFYGVEFVSPAQETSTFLLQLHGATCLYRIKKWPGNSAA